jgi:hypothetical protein
LGAFLLFINGASDLPNLSENDWTLPLRGWVDWSQASVHVCCQDCQDASLFDVIRRRQ